MHDSGQYNNVSWAAYFQDNWRVNNRLTLNQGVRWDGVPHTYEANNRLGNFYPNLYNPASAATLASGNSSIDPGSAGLGTSPNPILANTPICLNGIREFRGRTEFPRAWSTTTGLPSLRASALPMISPARARPSSAVDSLPNFSPHPGERHVQRGGELSFQRHRRSE